LNPDHPDLSIAAIEKSTDYRFGQQYKLLTAKQFSEVFSARRTLRGPHFILHYRANTLPDARLGLVIPKKQARRAVLRNAIKRQAREIFRRRRTELPAMDIVLRLALPLAPERSAWRDEIVVLLEQLCRKARA